MTIQEEITATKRNKVALLELIASKFITQINREILKEDSPILWFELLRYGQVGYDISYINIEILRNQKAK